jgi:hypothetical protein
MRSFSFGVDLCAGVYEAAQQLCGCPGDLGTCPSPPRGQPEQFPLHMHKFGFQRGRKTAHYTLAGDKTILQASGRCLAGNS